MILTGKALEDFRDWLFNKFGIKHKFHDDIEERFLISYIIEFFDSVGIYIGVYPATNCSQYLMFEISINDDWISEEENRQQATIQAIEKANDIYNNTDKV